MIREFLFDFFGYIVIFYSIGIILSYVAMVLLSAHNIAKRVANKNDAFKKETLFDSPYLPGVTIVAPAYNEEKTVVDNVKSLLDQDYPHFEVIIVNDGSKDSTLEKLIDEFAMVRIPFDYVEHIHTKPFRCMYHSSLPEYARLYVVDKENGGNKADAVNAGLNAVRTPYFINTDVDCILSRDAIFRCVLPVLEEDNVIAVSGAMTMSNGCKVRQGKLMNRRASWRYAPLFQTLEYMRSFFIGKMAWSGINGMPNVSGGYGLFKTDTMIAAGGYRSDSVAEDMEMVLDAVKYCSDFNIPHRIVQIPVTCCWTEGPYNVRILYRQRKRWARGLLQAFARHWSMVGNRKCKVTGLVTLPYIFVFEFLAPVIEMTGLGMIVYLLFTGGINYTAAIVLGIALYAFNLLLTVCVITFDYAAGSSFDRPKEYLKLAVAGLLEPLLYHPLLSAFSVIGYLTQLFSSRSSWGTMTRKGYADTPAAAQGQAAASAAANTETT